MKKLGALLICIVIVSIGLQAQNLATYYPNDRVKAFYTVEKNGLVQYTKYNENTQVIETGFYKAMEKVGVWRYYDNDGNLRMQETYVNGLRNGVCYKYSPSGFVTYQIVYKNGQRVEAIELNMAGMVVDSRNY